MKGNCRLFYASKMNNYVILGDSSVWNVMFSTLNSTQSLGYTVGIFSEMSCDGCSARCLTSLLTFNAKTKLVFYGVYLYLVI